MEVIGVATDSASCRSKAHSLFRGIQRNRTSVKILAKLNRRVLEFDRGNLAAMAFCFNSLGEESTRNEYVSFVIFPNSARVGLQRSGACVDFAEEDEVQNDTLPEEEGIHHGLYEKYLRGRRR